MSTLGSGRMARAIGARAVKGGNEVEVARRDFAPHHRRVPLMTTVRLSGASTSRSPSALSAERARTTPFPPRNP